MSAYESVVTGLIPIQPPIPVHRLASSKFLPDDLGHPHDWTLSVLYQVETIRVQRADGVLITATVAGIRPAQHGFYAAYDLGLQLDEIAAEVVAAGSTCEAQTAWLTRAGIDQGDVERYWFDPLEQTKAGLLQTHLSEKAQMRWPSDGTLVELSP